jgi:hypothetical protein
MGDFAFGVEKKGVKPRGFLFGVFNWGLTDDVVVFVVAYSHVLAWGFITRYYGTKHGEKNNGFFWGHTVPPFMVEFVEEVFLDDEDGSSLWHWS